MNYIRLRAKEATTSKVLLKNHGFSARAISEILKDGYQINDKNARKNKNLRPHDQLAIPIPDEDLDYEPVAGDLDIIYEDDHIMVINKRSGLTVNSKNQISLANHLAYYFEKSNIRAKVRLVNRLDMNTSGLLMIAKNKFAQSFYQKQIEANTFKKYYLALLEGKLDIDKLIELRLEYNDETKAYEPSREGALARTYLKTISTAEDYSKVEAEILTGKTHQIRSTLSSLGHPIIGDGLYGSNYDLERFFLHCYKIQFHRFLDEKVISLENNPYFPSISELI